MTSYIIGDSNICSTVYSGVHQRKHQGIVLLSPVTGMHRWPVDWPHKRSVTPWASYQIRKSVGCACAGNAENVFPATDFKGNHKLAIPTCITARASRTCRDACRDRQPAMAGENVPGIPGTCATRNFTYLARGPCRYHVYSVFASIETLFGFYYCIYRNNSNYDTFLIILIHKAPFPMKCIYILWNMY